MSTGDLLGIRERGPQHLQHTRVGCVHVPRCTADRLDDDRIASACGFAADDSTVDDLYLGRHLQKLGQRHLNIVDKSLRRPPLRRGHRLLYGQPPGQPHQLTNVGQLDVPAITPRAEGDPVHGRSKPARSETRPPVTELRSVGGHQPAYRDSTAGPDPSLSRSVATATPSRPTLAQPGTL